ncbi:MAG: glycosyltransferase family 4 protein [Puia sp.]|nr:glycosyltransferase family 4 protein [Puia sp.]
MNRKPRILLISDNAWWIIGEMGKQIIARFSDKYDFYFLTEGILPRRPDLLKALVSEVDAIHCISYETIVFLRDFSRKTLPPISTWIHHVTEWNADMQLAVEMSSAVTTCTSGWKEYLDERIEGRIPVTVVPHGVDADFFRRRIVDQRRFGIPPGRFVLGFIGKKGSDLEFGRKGTGVLLDVVRKAAAQLPDLHVVMGGPDWEREIDELRALGVSVSSTGYIRKVDVPALYSALDVYLLTSRVEGGPCTVLEAMACETAVVSTRVGAVPEWIVDGVNGYSADVDDTEGLLSAVVELGRSPEKRIAIGQEARSTAIQRPWRVALSPLEGVYDDLIQQRRWTSAPTSGPSWMTDPDGLLRRVCAADAMLTVYGRVRNGKMSITKGIGMLHEMLSGQPIFDVVKGAAMIRRCSAYVNDGTYTQIP